MKPTIEVLRDARALIAERKHWTKDTLARFGNNFEADVLDERACKFCAIGAIMRAACSDSASSPVVDAVMRRVGRGAGTNEFGIADFNDTHDHADVLAAFDRAIAAEESA